MLGELLWIAVEDDRGLVGTRIDFITPEEYMALEISLDMWEKD